MDKEITFDIEEFLNEDCKEENEIGIKMTYSILNKAFEKGIQNSAYYCYEKGKNDAKTEFITMLKELLKEFENLDPSYDCNTYYAAIYDCSNLLQQKIDKMKGIK